MFHIPKYAQVNLKNCPYLFTTIDRPELKFDRNFVNRQMLLTKMTTRLIILDCAGYISVPQLFVSLLLIFNNSSPLQFVSTTIRLHYNSSPLIFVSTTFRLHYYSSPHNSSPYYSSPTIRLHYYSSPLLFVSRQFVSNNSSPLLFVSITIRLHYYSSPLLFVSTTFRLHKIRLQEFVSTTIRVNLSSIIYNLVDVINNAGKKSYDGSFVSK